MATSTDSSDDECVFKFVYVLSVDGVDWGTSWTMGDDVCEEGEVEARVHDNVGFGILLTLDDVSGE